jgi:hypothetical protein
MRKMEEVTGLHIEEVLDSYQPLNTISVNKLRQKSEQDMCHACGRRHL